MQIDQWTSFLGSISDDTEAAAILKQGDAVQIAKLAQSRGFQFTEQDIRDAKVGSAELREEMLEGISGGMRGLFR